MPEERTMWVGVTVPEEYRDRLYEWVAYAPFDGCVWKKSHGVVDSDGNFHPLTAGGRDLDDFTDATETEHGLSPSGGWNTHGWNERTRKAIQIRHGFIDVEPPRVQFDRARNAAIEKVFGRKWYEVEIAKAWNDERVKAAVEKEAKALKAYEADMAEHERNRQGRLNALFLGAALDEVPDGWRSWPLDKGHAKESCREFCSGCGDDAGVMCTVLDGLLDLGYGAWCVCSDCGELFQPHEYEKFSHLLDPDSYRGNGGVGIVQTRVQCESCRAETECPRCGRPDLPAPRDGRHRYAHYTDVERFLGQWLGFCTTCLGDFVLDDRYSHWGDEIDELTASFDRDERQLEKYLAAMKDGGAGGERLTELRVRNEKSMRETWRKAVNALRDRMEDDVTEFFEYGGDTRLGEDDEDYIYN